METPSDRSVMNQPSTQGLGHRWRHFLFHRRVEWRIGSLHLCFERSPSGRRCCRNSRAQLLPLFRPMLTQMYVGGVMACTHDHAPLSKDISPMFPSAAHKCTLSLPILSEGRSLESLQVVWTVPAQRGTSSTGISPERVFP